MKAFKAFIKPFEAPQRSVKIKIYLNFLSSSGIGTGRVKMMIIYISFRRYLKKNDLNTTKVIFCDVIRCSVGVYNSRGN